MNTTGSGHHVAFNCKSVRGSPGQSGPLNSLSVWKGALWLLLPKVCQEGAYSNDSGTVFG